MMIHELSGKITKGCCEDCGKKTMLFQQGYITPLSRQLSYEKWLCGECVADDCQ